MMYFSRNLTFVLLCAFSGTAFAGSNCVNKILEEISGPKIPEELKNTVCQSRVGYSEAPFSKEAEELAESSTQLRSVETLKKIYNKHCMQSLYAGAAASGSYLTIGALREGGVKNVVTENGSNYILGLAMMNQFDQCLKAMSPLQAKNILIATLGSNIAGNIYFEVGLGQSDFMNHGKKITKTDYGDLTSGGLATLSYFVISKSIERATQIKMKRICN